MQAYSADGFRTLSKPEREQKPMMRKMICLALLLVLCAAAAVTPVRAEGDMEIRQAVGEGGEKAPREDTSGFFPENPDCDLENIRYEAAFEVPVSEGVWWVPVRSLGGSRYTNREIAGMAEHSPEQKQEEISSLYEALQLFKISGFSYLEDNAPTMENGIRWEHHKPGEVAVRANAGSCAADSAWLNYILNGDYDETGYMAYSMADGSGHALNYIYQDGYYYFIDMMGYEDDQYIGLESGNKGDYFSSWVPGGNLHKAITPENFAAYYADTMPEPPNRFFFYRADFCLPVSCMEMNGLRTIIYPEGYDIKVVDGKDPEKLGVAFVPGPTQTYNWSVWRSAKIRPAEKYLHDAEETAGEPLTSCRPGDVPAPEDDR